MALAIDGSAHTTISASSTTVSLTTTQLNDYIIVAVETNGGPVLSVSSVALGSLTFQGRGGTTTKHVEIWAAFSSAALTADTITVTATSSGLLSIDAFGVSGSLQTSLVFEGPITGNVDPISITTVGTNTMVIAAYRETSTSSPTAGAGFTAVSGADGLLSEYKVLSSAQTLSCTQTVGALDANGGVVIAIVQGVTATYAAFGTPQHSLSQVIPKMIGY